MLKQQEILRRQQRKQGWMEAYLTVYRMRVPCRSDSSISDGCNSIGNNTPEILQALMLAPSNLDLLKSTPRRSDCRK